MRVIRTRQVCLNSVILLAAASCFQPHASESAKKPLLASPSRVVAPAEIPLRLTMQEAVRVAAAELGLRTYDPARANATICTLSYQSIPFLRSSLAGRRTWRVEFNDICLARDTGRPNLDSRFIKQLVILLSPETGHVMRVASAWPPGVPPMLPRPDCAGEEEQLMAISEKFTGTPANPPSASLFDVISRDEAKCWSSDTKQILAYYVTMTHLGIRDRPVWVIQLRGTPPTERLSLRAGTTEPPDSLIHCRIVVDGRSGEFLELDNIPYRIAANPERRD